jgi:hypothetical protein
MRRILFVAVPAMAMFAASNGCSDETTVECAPGEVVSCDCPDPTITKRCRADGFGFHACACEASVGSGGAGGSGGSGGGSVGSGGGIGSFAPGEVVWARSAGDLFNEEGHALEVDSDGRLWVTGFIEGDTDFGGGELKVLGLDDVFLAQFAADGSHLASARFGDFDQAQGDSLALHEGQALVTGSFIGTFDFGGGTTPSNGHDDLFVAKLGLDGSASWSRGFGGMFFDGGEDVAVDASGNVYVAGYFMSDVDFGGGALTADAFDGYLLKLGPDGSFRWVLPFGGQDNQQCRALVVDDAGVWVGGSFETEIIADGTTTASAGGFDGFVARVTADGELALMVPIGDGDAQAVHALASSPLGGVVVGAELSGSATIGSSTVQSEGFRDMLVASLDANGQPRWMRALGGASNDWLTDVAVAPNGAVAIAGRFEQVFEVGDVALASEGGEDAVVLKLSAEGDLRWARRYGDNEHDAALGVAVDDIGSVFVTGYFTRDIEFGGTLDSVGLRDVLIARLAP